MAVLEKFQGFSILIYLDTHGSAGEIPGILYTKAKMAERGKFQGFDIPRQTWQYGKNSRGFDIPRHTWLCWGNFRDFIYQGKHGRAGEIPGI